MEHLRYLNAYDFPGRNAGQVPTIIIPDWGTSGQLLLQFADHFCDTSEGRTILLTWPRRYWRGTSLGTDDTALVAMQQAQHIQDVLAELSINRVNLVAHETGAFTAVQFAIRAPQQVASLQLVTPAGLLGTDTLRDFAYRKIKSSLDSLRYGLVFGPTSSQLRAAVRGIIADTGALFFKRGREKIQTTLESDLVGMIERDRLGMPTFIYQGTQDGVNPTGRARSVGGVTIIEIQGGRNDAPYLQPRVVCHTVVPHLTVR